MAPAPPRWIVGAAALTFAVAWSSIAGPPPETPGNAALTAAELREMEHLLANLRDGRLDMARRRVAAIILLDRPWPAAELEIRTLLLHSEDVTILRAIAQAVAQSQAPGPALIDPLMRLLGTEDARLRGDVAAALARFDNPVLTRQLIEIATDPARPTALRLGAIQSLADHRTPASAAVLIELIELEGNEPAVRDTAFESLAHFTGLDYGRDVAAWRRWWNRVNRFEGRAWAQDLMRTVSARNQELNQRSAALAARLTEAHTQLYDAAAESGRPTILQRMMADELPEIRLKALWLTEQRLLNNQPVSDGTRAAMRERLRDGVTAVRTQAARILEILADEKAAQMLAEFLTLEEDVQALTAYLRLLARVPQPSAIHATVQLLNHDELRGPAASCLVAARDKSLLGSEHAEAALQIVRSYLATAAVADPAMLRLLGRIGRAEDEALAARFLHEGPAASRAAAMEAFENELWRLAPLLDYLDDSTLRAAMWKLIAKRGRSAATLHKLLESAPNDSDGRAEWLKVVAAVASRLSHEDLLQTNNLLASRSDARDVHEAVLLSASGLASDGTPLASANGTAGDPTAERGRAEAELCLAEFYLRHREPGRARTVLARLADRTSLTVEQRRRVELGRLRRMLQQQALDEAAAHSTRTLTALEPLLMEELAGLWIDAAEEALTAGRLREAQAIAARIAELFSDKLDASTQARLADFRRRLSVAAPAGGDETRQARPTDDPLS